MFKFPDTIDENSPQMPSLMPLSNVYGNGYNAAVMGGANENTTIVKELTNGEDTHVVLEFASLFGRMITLTGGPASTRAYMEELLPDILDGTLEPGRVFDVTVDLDGVPDGYKAMDNREALKVLIKP